MLDEDQVQAANRVLVRYQDVVHGVLDPLLRATDPAHYENEILKLAYEVKSPFRYIGPVLLPERSELVRRLETYTEAFDKDLADDLLLALNASSEHYRIPGRGFYGLALGRFVYNQILELGMFLKPTKTDPESKLRNGMVLTERLGSPLSSADIKMFAPSFRFFVKLQRQKSTLSKKTTSPVKQELSDMGSIVRFLTSEDIAVEGRLPSATQLRSQAPGALEAIEEFLYPEFSSYRAFCSYLVQEYEDIRYPVSSNEMALRLVVEECFSEENSPSFYYDQCYFEDSRLRPDILVSFTPDGVIPGLGSCNVVSAVIEADGQGHFEQVSNWDLVATVRNDIKKAELVANAARDGEKIFLIGVHYQACKTLKPEDLKLVLDFALAKKAVWVFIRPIGSKDMRASHEVPKKARVSNLNFEVFYI